MPERLNPLNEEHCECLDRVLRETALTRQLIADCKECLMDAGDREVENEMQADIAGRYKRTFFPGRV